MNIESVAEGAGLKEGSVVNTRGHVPCMWRQRQVPS